uniref:Uncharacterized protein n=1 Tax=Caenorhabditis japonica TaxID=281687 RepID=A0A8R1EL71_CAEJA
MSLFHISSYPEDYRSCFKYYLHIMILYALGFITFCIIICACHGCYQAVRARSKIRRFRSLLASSTVQKNSATEKDAKVESGKSVSEMK